METNDNVLLKKLREKLKKEEERYKKASREDCIRLPRKQYFSVMRKQMQIQRSINTIKVAIDFVENGLRKTDVYAAVVDCFAPTRDDIVDLEYKANSIYLRERAEVMKIIFEDVLPICKKEIIKQLQQYLT